MASEKPETDGFLALLEAKIEALLALKESYLRSVSLGAWGQPGDVGGDAVGLSSSALQPGRAQDQAVELPTGAFLNKSLPDAIKLFLSATKRKQIPRDVAATLREGGFESTSRNFEKTVNGTMHRMKDMGVLLKFPDGAFGLTEFYPEHLRNRIAHESKQVKKPAKKGKDKGAPVRAQGRPHETDQSSGDAKLQVDKQKSPTAA